MVLLVLTFSCVLALGQEKTADYWIDQGKTFSSEGSYDIAIKCYDKAIEIDPQNAYSWYYKGWSLGRLGKYNQAFEAYNTSVNIDPVQEKAWIYRGLALLMDFRTSEAIMSFDNAIKVNQSDDFAWFVKGLAITIDDLWYWWSGSYTNEDTALKCFDKIIQQNQSAELIALSHSLKALIFLHRSVLSTISAKDMFNGKEVVVVLESYKDINETMNSLNKAIASNPTDTYILDYDGLRKLNKSNRSYIDGYVIEPTQLLAWNYGFKGYMLNGTGNHEEALSYFDEALKMNTSVTNEYNNASNILRAIVEYRSGQNSSRDFVSNAFADCWLAKALAFQALGRHEDALKCLENANELNRESGFLSSIAMEVILKNNV